MVRFRRAAGVVALVLVAATFSACSGGADASSGDAVTDAEFKAAAQRAADCLRDEGWSPDGPRPGSAGIGWIVGVSIEGVPDDEQKAAMSAILDQCWKSNVGDLERHFYDGLALTGEQRDAAYGDFLVCLKDAGVDGVKMGDSEEVVGAAIGEDPEGIACMQKYLWMLFNNQDG